MIPGKLRFAFAVSLFLCAADARAQKLTLQGDKFAVDGTPKFLTFISYFGGMGAANPTADLHLMKSLGFDGFRIWPCLDTGPQLMNGDGSLRQDEFRHFLSILDAAKAERLIVDVTFSYEHISGMTPQTAKTGIVNVATAIRSYENVLFDLQNERNVGDRRYMGESDLRAIYLAVKAVDPARIATASYAPEPPRDAADSTARIGFDVTAYHDPRPYGWYTLAEAQWVVDELKTNGKPVYLQEPMTTYDDFYFYPEHDRAEYFLQAIAHAKLAGAAGWCFHTWVGVDMRGSPPLLEDRLRAIPEPEWAFATSLNQHVVLRAGNGNHFVVAQGGGGGGVRVDRSASGPGSWEVFGVTALNGGPVLSGDRVALSTPDGRHYLQAVGGGGGPMRAESTSIGSFETFTIEKKGGGVIHHGDAVTLRAGNYFVVAEGGGGSSLNANSVAAGSWETFTILFVTPHAVDFAKTSVIRGDRRRS